MKSRQAIARLRRLCRIECARYLNKIDLIAASSFRVQQDAIQLNDPTLRNVLAQRTTEGNLFAKPYAGTKHFDDIEQVAVEAAKHVFGAGAANVQPHSGSQANQAAYFAFLRPKDKVLALTFDAGGHLSHGSPTNFSGRMYAFNHYDINKHTQLIDYDHVEERVKRCKPRLLIAGASSYPRTIDYKRMAAIAHSHDCLFMADISHPAGLIAARLHPSPFPHADVVTTSTEKTLCGPHGGIVMAREQFARLINKAVHPGIQSSVPLERLVRVGSTLLFAQTATFRQHAKRVLDGAKVLEKRFGAVPNCLLFGGTDTHFVVINTLAAFGLTGKSAEEILERLHILTSRQVLPWDKTKRRDCSGLRIGVPAAVGQGYTRRDFDRLSQIIIDALRHPNDTRRHKDLRRDVTSLITRHENGDAT